MNLTSIPNVGAPILLACMLTMTGCHSTAYKVATIQNEYDFRLARYTESCRIVSPPTWCSDYYAKLLLAEKHLHEAAAAVKNGGAMTLQLQAIQTDEKVISQK